MATTEIMGDGRSENKPGVYRREDGKEMVTSTGNFGRIQADAFVQQGYVWVAPVPSKTEKEEVKTETPKAK